MPASSIVRQSGSHASSCRCGASGLMCHGNGAITTPLWPFFIDRSASARASSTEVTGRMHCGTNRGLAAAHVSSSQSL